MEAARLLGAEPARHRDEALGEADAFVAVHRVRDHLVELGSPGVLHAQRKFKFRASANGAIPR
jgi:hypothetical protein